jgi:hypothetical protein
VFSSVRKDVERAGLQVTVKFGRELGEERDWANDDEGLVGDVTLFALE